MDDPASAVGAADRLIQSVMRERGYPVEDFDQRADDLSVDYPDVVQNYREGRQLSRAGRDMDKGSTEYLRRAFRCYRALFEELVGSAGAMAGPEEPGPRGRDSGPVPSRNSTAVRETGGGSIPSDSSAQSVPSAGSREQIS